MTNKEFIKNLHEFDIFIAAHEDCYNDPSGIHFLMKIPGIDGDNAYVDFTSVKQLDDSCLSEFIFNYNRLSRIGNFFDFLVEKEDIDDE